MGIHVPSLAALLGLLSITATAAAATPLSAQGGTDSTSPATRFEGGASASVTVSARIIRQSASIGASLAPPAPGMAPRETTVSAADGRAVPALVYDFQ